MIKDDIMALMKLQEICSKIGSGATPKGGKEAYLDSGISLIRSQNVLDYSFSYSGLAHINEEQAERLSNVIVEKGDLLLNITGDSVARVCKVDESVLPARVNQHVAIIRVNEEYALGSYLLCYLQKIKPLLIQLASGGATRNALTKGMIENLEIDIPSLTIQHRIVSVFDDVQKKIAINSAINQNLAEQAEALFKERFLSYEDLPLGWKKMTLGDISDMGAGGDKPKIISDQKTETYQYPIYSNGISDEGLYGFSSDYKISSESVTVSARGTIGFVCLRHIPYTPIVRLVTLVPHTDVVSAKYLYLWLKSIPIHGTGTTQQQLTVPDFRKTEIVIPTEAEMREFTETVDPLFQQIWANQKENSSLADIRDTLLPRLMSGEIDVSKLVD